MKSVDDFILKRDVSQRKVLNYLRQLIKSISPEIREEFKWKVPYYSYRGNLCYLNERKGTVEIGFARGKELSKRSILSGDGKEVRHIKYTAAHEPDEETVIEVIKEAMYLNESKIK